MTSFQLTREKFLKKIQKKFEQKISETDWNYLGVINQVNEKYVKFEKKYGDIYM